MCLWMASPIAQAPSQHKTLRHLETTECHWQCPAGFWALWDNGSHIRWSWGCCRRTWGGGELPAPQQSLRLNVCCGCSAHQHYYYYFLKSMIVSKNCRGWAFLTVKKKEKSCYYITFQNTILRRAFCLFLFFFPWVKEMKSVSLH